MDWLTFIVEIAKALGWPGAFVVALLVLRKPLKGLIPLLTKLKYKDIELEFGKGMELAKEEAAALPQPENRKLEQDLLPEKIMRLAAVAPRAGVLESWRMVEAELAALGRRLPSTLQKAVSAAGPLHIRTNDVLRQLEHEQQADPRLVSVLRHLKHLRNEAAHAPEFTLSEEAALEYGILAEEVRLQLERLGV
jgi:hypothetical protein